MYIPKHFREEDTEKIKLFIKAHNFGVILSSKDGEMVGTHLPFILVEKEDDSFFLKSHLAAGNPQLKHWQSNSDCLIIFSGPHGYVSPSLYEEKQNVPTWNYIAVHVYGSIKVYDDFDQKKDLLIESIHSFEPEYMKQWDDLNITFRDKLINGMTGMDIQITKIEAKYKLSQNKPESTRQNVAGHFTEEGNELGKFME